MPTLPLEPPSSPLLFTKDVMRILNTGKAGVEALIRSGKLHVILLNNTPHAKRRFNPREVYALQEPTKKPR